MPECGQESLITEILSHCIGSPGDLPEKSHGKIKKMCVFIQKLELLRIPSFSKDSQLVIIDDTRGFDPEELTKRSWAPRCFVFGGQQSDMSQLYVMHLGIR